METTTLIVTILAVIILLVVGGYLGVVFTRRQRTKRLREQFGPEYERVLKDTGDQREVEEELEARLDHVKSLDIRQLSEEEREQFTRDWRATQAKFVDQPAVAIQEAEELLTEVMDAKGYPVDDFEQRAADISVKYPELVMNYRGMREITTRSDIKEVSTEEMRQAMIHSRALFEELVGTEVNTYKNQKEKM